MQQAIATASCSIPIHGSLPESTSKRHQDRFVRFCTAHGRDQQTDKHTHTDHATCVTIGRRTMRREENCRHRRCWTVASFAGTFWRRRRLAVPALSFAAATWNRLPAAGPRSRDETYCKHHHRCTKCSNICKDTFSTATAYGPGSKTLHQQNILYNGRNQWLLLLVFQRYFIINNVITNVAQNEPWGRKEEPLFFYE